MPPDSAPVISASRSRRSRSFRIPRLNGPKSLIKFARLKRYDVALNELRQLSRLAGADLAGGDRGDDRRHCANGVAGALQRRRYEADRSLAAGRQYAVQTQAQCRAIAAERKLDDFAGQCLGFAIEQRFGCERGAVSRAPGLTRWAAALALDEWAPPLISC